MVAKHLGVLIKVFQFGVVGYDLLLSRPLQLGDPAMLLIGAALVAAGQALNSATFNAIGAKGVYYGSQLGYDVPWYEGFPYNIGVGDPQYWGVILCIWGLYLMVLSNGNVFDAPYVVPWL